MDENITKSVYDLHTTSPVFRTLINLFGIFPYNTLTNPITFILVIIVTLYIKRPRLLSLYIIPYILTLLIVVPIKYATKRIRPGCNPNLNIPLKTDPTYYKLICRADESFLSFPSGHTTLITAILTAFAINFDTPLFTAITTVIILFTALQRMSYGYHYLTDTIIGLILGLIIGYVSYKYLSYK